ncbi:MAG: cation transporting ATPase C-terminal domain-containing protein [Cyanobacteria bacterium J06607_15]
MSVYSIEWFWFDSQRDNHQSLFLGALLICTGLLSSSVYLSGLSGVLQTVDPGLNGWVLAIAMSFIPLIVGQLTA